MKPGSISKRFKALIGLTIITGIAMLVLLGVYLWATFTERPTLETSLGTALGLTSLAFSVFLGVTLSAPPESVRAVFKRRRT